MQSPEWHHKPIKWATLRQAVLWVALEFPPLEARFERLEEYPSDVREDMDLDVAWADSSDMEIERAKRKIARFLMLGVIIAEGRRAFQAEMLDSSHPRYAESLDWDVPEENHSKIPASFWDVEHISWQSSQVRRAPLQNTDDEIPVTSHFVNVRVATEDLFRAYPGKSMTTVFQPEPMPAIRRGPKEKYDKLDFFILCALEAEVNELPATEADFLRRMAVLLAVVWGENATPGKGWLQDRFKEIQFRRAAYERGRRLLEGAEISD